MGTCGIGDGEGVGKGEGEGGTIEGRLRHGLRGDAYVTDMT